MYFDLFFDLFFFIVFLFKWILVCFLFFVIVFLFKWISICFFVFCFVFKWTLICKLAWMHPDYWLLTSSSVLSDNPAVATLYFVWLNPQHIKYKYQYITYRYRYKYIKGIKGQIFCFMFLNGSNAPRELNNDFQGLAV